MEHIGSHKRAYQFTSHTQLCMGPAQCDVVCPGERERFARLKTRKKDTTLYGTTRLLADQIFMCLRVGSGG